MFRHHHHDCRILVIFSQAPRPNLGNHGLYFSLRTSQQTLMYLTLQKVLKLSSLLNEPFRLVSIFPYLFGHVSLPPLLFLIPTNTWGTQGSMEQTLEGAALAEIPWENWNLGVNKSTP